VNTPNNAIVLKSPFTLILVWAFLLSGFWAAMLMPVHVFLEAVLAVFEFVSVHILQPYETAPAKNMPVATIGIRG
jgi:hypothetical protein